MPMLNRCSAIQAQNFTQKPLSVQQYRLKKLNECFAAVGIIKIHLISSFVLHGWLVSS